MKTLPHDHGQKFEQMCEQIPGPEAFQIVADLFKQMGDLSRVRIFWLLCHCEECVINISSLMEMSSPAVSHHLKQLKMTGLIISAGRVKRSIIRLLTRYRHRCSTI